MTTKRFEAEAFAIDDEGKGMVADNGTTFFVSNLLKGERAVIETVYNYGRLKEARVVKRLNSSPDRVNPPCPYYERCGGCSLMHLDYPAQLEYKRLKVQNLLKKFGKIDFNVEATVGLCEPWRFRNKIQKPVRSGKKHGEICTGFFAENSHDLVTIDRCLIEDKRSEQITELLLRLGRKYKVSAYNEDTGSGLLRHILIKTSAAYDEVMVCLVTAADVFPGLKNLVRELVTERPDVKTVVQNINPRHTNVILGEKERIVYGAGRIKDRIFDLDFLISAKSFYQTNPRQIEKLYGLAIDRVGLRGDETVLDAYCGTGTIGLCVAKKVKKVVGIEVVKEAVHDAVNNAKINSIGNAEFIAADCTEYLLSHPEQKFDVVFLDPPRKGSTPEFLNAIKSMKPNYISYISCNPVTLARDLTYLTDTYKIESVVPVDLFPHSAHVECVCLMTRIER